MKFLPQYNSGSCSTACWFEENNSVDKHNTKIWFEELLIWWGTLWTCSTQGVG